MNVTTQRRAPEMIFREGKPRAVILDIEIYQEMLERLEDMEDLRILREMRAQPLAFRKLEDFLQEVRPNV